ncbi:hypothetical protein WV31_13030 [Magnetospirillum sp. ME-1]|uniref:NAD-dependent epimerase/dehydratase family protein n=1 Tax=Magnetospirillum sp. ME-1 TaxID=1639348 RepID=UPI000A17EA07|nr:SDR family oxidoreductase [Magnetospirillum sp. ME-1]ARJ66526.1 hypothetical protein WV31_13030 [Magnetospirillum sp. ME-1]
MSGPILVTGGFGYLGGRIVCGLVAAGHRVRVTTRRAPAAYPGWAAKVEVRDEPIDTGGWAGVLNGVAAIVHLAAANEIDCGRDPAGCVEPNVTAAIRLIEAARAAKVGRFVYFSTAHVYGAPLEGRIDETRLPRPIHPYAITHRAAEDFVLAAHDQGWLEGVVVRLSNGFGAPADSGIDRWTLLANDLCRQAATQGRLVMRSTGLQRRDFITLADVAGAVVHLLGLPRATLGDGLFNVGGAYAPTVYEMAGLIAQRAQALLGREVEIERPQPRPDETAAPLDYRIDKLKATGFAPAGDVAGEIDATLRLCREAFA